MKFYVSGGIKEEDVPGLNHVVDGYGVGTSISNAPVLDFSMDIVEVDGERRAKRGKRSGAKRLLECASCGRRRTISLSKKKIICDCGKPMKDILVPAMNKGKYIYRIPKAKELRRRVLKNAAAAAARAF